MVALNTESLRKWSYRAKARGFICVLGVGSLLTLFTLLSLRGNHTHASKASHAIDSSRLWQDDQQVYSKLWAVVTTINEPTDAIKKLAALPGWKVVVVGDMKTPKHWSWQNCTFLGVEKQETLQYEIMKSIPFLHYARKNIGYLYAIQHGAELIYETDDDNELISDLRDFDLFSSQNRIIHQYRYPINSSRIVCNPYAHFGQATIWPRGYPLSNIADPPCAKYVEKTVKPSIQQGLANGDPDVDAIFRLTRKDRDFPIRIQFDSQAPPVAYPPGMFAPFNSQNTLFRQEAFWATLIPVSTAFRVCDIWRGYWAQRLLWEIGGALVFYPPSVLQLRNPHDYLKDYIDEYALYNDAHRLVDFLARWRSNSSSFFMKVRELSKAMAAEGFWGQGDAEMAIAWTNDLVSIGYPEPSLANIHWEDSIGSSKNQEQAKELTYFPKKLGTINLMDNQR